MLLLTSIVSVCVAMSLIWIGFVVSCITHNTFDGSYIIALMGLFLPFVVIGFGIAFVYLFTEIKKIQDLLISPMMTIGTLKRVNLYFC